VLTLERVRRNVLQMNDSGRRADFNASIVGRNDRPDEM
jgi:hypothetical protein